MGRRSAPALTLLLLTLAVIAAGCGGSATATATAPASAPTSEGHRAHRRARVNNNDTSGGFIRALLRRGGYAVLADALVNLTSVAAEMGRLASEGRDNNHGLTLLAPTDAAMARAGLGGGPAWHSRSSPPLDDVLRSHLLRGLQTAEMVSLSVRWFRSVTYATLRAPLTVTAQAGSGSVPVVFFGQGGYVNVAHLSDPDVYVYGNISVQGIDAVLFPPQHVVVVADSPSPLPAIGLGQPRRPCLEMECPPPPLAAAAAADAPSGLPPAAADARRSSSITPYPVKSSWGRPSRPPLVVARGHLHHVETGMLFPRKSLVPGAILPEGTKFAGRGHGGFFPAPPTLTFRAADADAAVPFSYDRLDTILRTFGIPRGSKNADQVAATLRTCEAASASSPPEPHTCATSRQAMAEFAASALGTTASELRAVATAVHGEDEPARYVVARGGAARIGGGKEGGTSALVPCIPMVYPYVVHYCHRPPHVEALRVELMGLGKTDDGGASATTTAVAICHADTASWDARYFKMLNATRGEEICYFMPLSYVLWLPAAAL
ncbi:hypothetical protein U9M48_011766 [Paspalum notatum var. saurae]|uniref:BURP domain-containing protein n=1 Tax=Paspalum notatum var. saurae TaxID=547442 RepID=A0AAQ3WI12_PASNO